MEEAKQEYKKYSQHMYGQFSVKSKKAQAMFIGRSIQLLRSALEDFREDKKLQMETLRFIIEEEPLKNDEGKEVEGWILIEVRYEVGSLDPYTEEDRKRDEERLKEAKKRQEEEEKQYGEAAIEEAEREIRSRETAGAADEAAYPVQDADAVP
jgi:hypothetical protein